MPVPLARRLLFQNKLRMLASLVGVAVAVLLVLQNLALYRGIQRYASILVQRVGGDLWVVASGTQFFELGNNMPSSVLYKARSVSGVATAERMNYVPAGFRCSEGNGGPINFIGLDPINASIGSSMVEGEIRRLSEVGAVVVDRSITRKCSLKLGGEFKGSVLGDPTFHVVGFTQGISPLTTIPYAFVSMGTLQSFSVGTRDVATFVVVRAKPGTDILLLKSALARVVAPNEVLTQEEFLLRHDQYWKRTADLRIVLLITSTLALFVGLLVVGQTVYSSTLEHLRLFGTLKAIGASNRFVTQVVIKQAAWAGALGFLSGVGLSIPAGLIIKQFLPSEMTVWQIGVAFALVAAICVISALAPIRRIVKLDPSEVFR